MKKPALEKGKGVVAETSKKRGSGRETGGSPLFGPKPPKSGLPRDLGGRRVGARYSAVSGAETSKKGSRRKPHKPCLSEPVTSGTPYKAALCTAETSPMTFFLLSCVRYHFLSWSSLFLS